MLCSDVCLLCLTDAGCDHVPMWRCMKDLVPVKGQCMLYGKPHKQDYLNIFKTDISKEMEAEAHHE